MLPLTINIKDAYANGKDDEQKFIQNLSLFLCTFLKEHGQLVEKKVYGNILEDDLFSSLLFQCTLTARANVLYVILESTNMKQTLQCFR